jgi:hypothetical protein
MPKQQPIYGIKGEQSLMVELWDAQLQSDPHAFAMFAFPWGKPNTPLEHMTGPRGWQKETFQEITRHIKSNDLRQAQKSLMEMWRSADASGRGIGKSALVAMLTLWFLTTRLGSTTIITANTEQQLKSRTMAELGKWAALSINSHWWEMQAMSLRPAEWYGEAIKRDLKIDLGYYYAAAQLWSEENPDAFAGIHNHHGVMLIMDEASGIPKPIWTVSEGFFTEPIPNRYWFVFSNPRRNSGAFFECFHKDRDFWRTRNIDSRTVEGTDRGTFDKIIKQYGEDSDQARVEVKGQFPRQGDKQFISREIIDNATTREPIPDPGAPLIMGVDVARYGDDSSVIRFRKGRDARSIPPIQYKGMDNMQLAYACADLIGKLNPDAVCIDAGNGTGVIDRLKELGFRVHEVWFGSKSTSPEWANKRTEMWADMRDWLNGGCIDAHQELIDDLGGPEYKFFRNGDSLILESKEDMKARGMHSPDHGDALCLTFAVKVARADSRTSRRNMHTPQTRMAHGVEESVFGF